MSEVIITKDNAPTAIVTLENGQQITVNIGGSGAAAAENGIPAGGDTGQILAKSSADDFAAAWVDPPADGADGLPGADGADGVGVPTGGTTGQVLAKATDSDFETEWVDPASGGATPSKWDSLDTFVVTAAAGKFMNTGQPYSSFLSSSLSVGIFMPVFVRFSSDVAIDQIGFRSGATGSNVKTLIYKLRSDGSGISDLVHTAAAVASENGYVMGSETFTFLAHEVYLIGILVDVSIATYRASAPQNMKTGYHTASTVEQYGYYWSGLSFAAPPSTLDLASASPNGSTHLAFMRIAA